MKMKVMENGVLEATKLISEARKGEQVIKKLLFYKSQAIYQSMN